MPKTKAQPKVAAPAAKAGQQPHKPTDKHREFVKMSAVQGVRHDDIAASMSISKPTLLKYYREELDHGLVATNAAVAGTLFQMATVDRNVAAAIFWLKTRAGWREAPQQVEVKDTTEQIAVEKRDELVSRVMTLIDNVRKREAEAAQATPAPPQILPPDKTKH